jgi:hypothetical protein
MPRGHAARASAVKTSAKNCDPDRHLRRKPSRSATTLKK